MRPEQAARSLARIGVSLLAILLFLRGLSLSETMQIPSGAEITEAKPVTDQFTISEDGKQITFREVLDPPPTANKYKVTPEWFTMRIEGGQILPTNEPEVDILPFVLREEQLFLLVGNGVSLTTGSPPENRVKVVALSPDRKEIAFYATQGSDLGGLYILNSQAELRWLGEENSISSISWSPDTQQIAYIAPREGINQVFTLDHFGKSLRQVTYDEGEKSKPAWLADSQTVVYIRQNLPLSNSSDLALPTYSIYQFNPVVNEEELLAGGLAPISMMETAGDHKEIFFTQPGAKHIRREQLFLLDPVTHSINRLYPPLSIESFTCPKETAQNSDMVIRFDLTNTSQLPATVPLILRAGTAPIAISGEREKGALRIEGVDLNPGERRQEEWTVAPLRGLRIYYSMIINLDEIYPMAEEHCEVLNTYLGLPNIAYLPFTLPLMVPGMLLTIPWLRHKKSRWLWAALAAYPFVIGLMIFIEVHRIY